MNDKQMVENETGEVVSMALRYSDRVGYTNKMRAAIHDTAVHNKPCNYIADSTIW